MNTVFFRLLYHDEKDTALSQALHAADGDRFEVDPVKFRTLPLSPFAYWVSDRVRATFTNLPPFSSDGRTVKAGIQTGDDFRFVRTAWETAYRDDRTTWPFSKGGANVGFYTDFWLSSLWNERAREIEAFVEPSTGRARSRVQNAEYYGHPGLTYTYRAARFTPQVLPAGVLISVRGSGIFVDGPEKRASDDTRLAYLGVLNSRAFDALLKLMLGRGGHPQFDMGDIAATPTPASLDDRRVNLAGLARRAWSVRRSLDTRLETSHAFVLPALLQVEGDSFATRADAWASRVGAVEAELEEIQAEIDERCFDLYGLDGVDRRAISEGLAGDAAGVDAEGDADELEDADEEQDVEAGVDVAGLAAELASWAVGVAFGRFDVRLATGGRELPGEPEPFDPLPVCSPGMLVGEDALPVGSPPSGYAIDLPWDGVLVDDPGDPRDLTAAARAVFDAIFGADADARWEEAAALLDPRGHELRGWLAGSFFELHLKLYSKSRRKAPIVWQLGTPSGRYSVWLYAHRLTEDSFFRLRNDVLAPKLAFEERRLAELVERAGESPSSRQRKEIEAQEKFVEELRVLVEEVRRVAPLWRATLDDGIVLVMAPLWRLVSHKPWQRELKKKWSELADGKYDWAQIAMHLWPERVIPKCAEDRSLAIAHDLEDVFWAEDEGGNWRQRDEPTRPADELIRERASTAVQEALGAAA